MKHILFKEGICLLRAARSFQVNNKSYSLRKFIDLSQTFFWLDPVETIKVYPTIRLSELVCPIMEVLGNRILLKGRKCVADSWLEPEPLFIDLELHPMAVEWINSYGYFVPYQP